MDGSLPGFLCPSDSPGENTGVGYHALLLGIFPTQRSNLRLSCLLHWQLGFCATGASWESPPTPTNVYYYRRKKEQPLRATLGLFVLMLYRTPGNVSVFTVGTLRRWWLYLLHCCMSLAPDFIYKVLYSRCSQPLDHGPVPPDRLSDEK